MENVLVDYIVDDEGTLSPVHPDFISWEVVKAHMGDFRTEQCALEALVIALDPQLVKPTLVSYAFDFVQAPEPFVSLQIFNLTAEQVIAFADHIPSTWVRMTVRMQREGGYSLKMHPRKRLYKLLME